ncbi:MAG TPA: hypothetical protein VFN11_20485 [Ktedonobacterales bacterium]|nr:hypothetical protein [Ktedonobacterales bacterium]
MTKATITRMWIAGLIVLVAGLLVGGISVGLMLAFGGTFTPAVSGNGQEFVPRLDGFFWTTVGFTVVGFTIAVVGGIIQLAAWIGALVNTYQIEDKAWFIGLLIGGLLGLGSGIIGFAAMVAYLVAGPDGARAQAPQTPMFTPAPAPYPSAPPAAQPVPEQPPLVHAS